MLICTPVAGNSSLPLGFVKSLLGVKQYTHVFQEGPSIADNRNELFERARFENESCLMIDSDMVFTPVDVALMESLLGLYDIVTGICVMSWPFNPPSLFKKNERGNYMNCEPEKKVVYPFEVDGCGAAFLGISKKVVQDLVNPFTPIQDPVAGRFYGEDISFCKRAQEAGYKIWADPSLSIGHIKSQVRYYGDSPKA